MPHDPLALFLRVGDAFALLFRHSPAFAASSTGEGWYASAGEANGIFNWVGVTSASPVNQETLREAVARFRGQRLDGLVSYPSDAEAALAPTFRELGLGEPDEVPLMACGAAGVAPLAPPLAPSDVAVERVSDAEGLAAAMRVPAATFEMPIDETLRAFDPRLVADPAVAVYAAKRGASVLGTLVSTRVGTSVSIDIMAVDPTAQRQGIGRALLLRAIHDQLTTGATTFHLLSSTEGKRLYVQTGFTTVLPTLLRDIPVDPVEPGGAGGT